MLQVATGQAPDTTEQAQIAARLMVEGIVDPLVHDLIGQRSLAAELFEELDALFLGNESGFWLTEHPAFTARITYRINGSVDDHIVAWRAFATRAAAFGYAAESREGFWDFIKSVETVREVVVHARRVPAAERTMRRAIVIFREVTVPRTATMPRVQEQETEPAQPCAMEEATQQCN